MRRPARVRLQFSVDDPQGISFLFGKDCRLVFATEWPILRGTGLVPCRAQRGDSEDATSHFSSTRCGRYLLLKSQMEKLRMRQDRTVPIERKDDERRDGTTGRAQTGGDETSTDQADGSSTDVRTDAPAALSAVSFPADIEEAVLSDEEIEMYRRRVAEGMYNTREVAAEVARRMLRRGDI